MVTEDEPKSKPKKEHHLSKKAISVEDVDPLLPRLTVAQKSVQEYSVFKAKPSQDTIKLQGVASQDSQM